MLRYFNITGYSRQEIRKTHDVDFVELLCKEGREFHVSYDIYSSKPHYNHGTFMLEMYQTVILVSYDMNFFVVGKSHLTGIGIFNA